MRRGLQQRAWWPVLALALALLPDCRAQPIAYQPAPSLTRSEAKRIIMQVMEEQPGKHAPADLEVFNEKIEIHSWRRRNKTVIYFGSISEVDLHQKRGWHIVRIRDTTHRRRAHIYIRGLGKAQQFMDCIAVMRAEARARQADPNWADEKRRLKRLRELTDEIDEIRRAREKEQQDKELEIEAEEPMDAL